jgi:hypothetical protein
VDAGLGIELTELAGGREDGLDITVVPRLVEGGLATAAESVEGADNKEPVIMAGHSIPSRQCLCFVKRKEESILQPSTLSSRRQNKCVLSPRNAWDMMQAPPN